MIVIFMFQNFGIGKMIFSINFVNFGNMSRYYEVNIVSGTSKPDMLLHVSRYVKPWLFYF